MKSMSSFFKKASPFLLILLGICLVLISGAFSPTAKKENVIFDDYTDFLENKIEELLLQMNGINEVTVFITLENSGETVYAENFTSNSSEYVVFSSDNYQNGLILAENAPLVRGVAVICTNGNDIKIQSKVVSLLSSALGIPTNRISVCG
ncbi:MAG: hypothetical protein IKL36_01715 [Clostridia bacterium]|nr:hypothetical protein [Clostridia bacterium]